MQKLEAEVTVRLKNQVTIPQSIADRFGIVPGQRMILVDEGIRDQFTIRVIRSSYAGVLSGMFGTTEENVAYVHGERDSWD